MQQEPRQERNLYRPQALMAKHPGLWKTENCMRAFIHSKRPELVKRGGIIKMGRALLLDEDAVFAVLDQYREEAK